MTFLYLVPTGMNAAGEPTWGSWAGRYGPREGAPGRAYFWANRSDAWRGSTSRENTLGRWAADIQNDFPRFERRQGQRISAAERNIRSLFRRGGKFGGGVPGRKCNLLVGGAAAAACKTPCGYASRAAQPA